TSVPQSEVYVVPKRLKSVGGNLTLVRSSRLKVPTPRFTASASMSAVHVCPSIAKLACDQAQREKACAIAPVTKLRACALCAIAGSGSGAEPGTSYCPAFL